MSTLESMPSPVLPQLQPDWEANTALRIWHEAMQHHTVASYRDRSPVGRLLMQGAHTGAGIRYVDIIPKDTADEKDAIVIMHNFAGGWGVRGAVRHEALLAALPEPRRLIAFPNAVVGQEVASYSPQERHHLAAGDFTPLTDRVLNTCQQLGIRSVQTAGYSQGAATGGAVLAQAGDRNIEARHSGLFDPPNVVARAPFTLMRDFVATGVSGGFRAAQVARIPLLDETNGAVARARAHDRARSIRNYVHPHNRAIARGLTRASFERNAFQFLRNAPEAQLLCMRAAQSTVTPKAGYQKQLKHLADHYVNRVHSIEIADIGHEFAENPIAYALLSARALYPVTY